MCLLVVLSRVHRDAPLVLAANRDEWLARPASPMVVHRERDPRIVGGRDEQAGGTWLAVNDHGVVAALTNRPGAPGTATSLRSRGAIPLALANHRSAREAAEHASRTMRCEDYRGCWVFVADRASLFHLDVHGTGAPRVVELPPGVHVLENNPIEPRSPKAQWVHDALAGHAAWRGDALVDGLWRVLGSHVVPDLDAWTGTRDDATTRLPVTHAACVHAGPYGTRWSAVIRVSDGGIDVRHAEGTPCITRPARSIDVTEALAGTNRS